MPCSLNVGLESVITSNQSVSSKMNTRLSSVILLAPSTLCFLQTSTKHPEVKWAIMPSSKTRSSSSSVAFHALQGSCFLASVSKKFNKFQSLTITSMRNKSSRRTCFDISLGSGRLNYNFRAPRQTIIRWSQHLASGGLFVGLVCNSSSEPVQADAPESKQVDDGNISEVSYSHGKKVCTDYSVTRIPGDGRCLFRSVAHGACLRAGKPAPDEKLQRELADDLRAKVVDELVRRREETEWFIEGDFEIYVSKMKKPHVWGGEPEILMACHVLQMPITVYMHNQDSGGLISIAEYGQEYGKDNPINVLYHGYGHYEALQIPGKAGRRSRM
ncbi:OLC1v1037026C1 [Oldenlandia corymbosa var. corymbosa]|uniref:Ubiquitin thioesterase OTU n=1 Tax=Oldenlandia corymbosa var. corymbosa TaxID=529605 RepID=A0AAV1CXL2_OLDCO|nr:OLC1v1037026C1 [Oldenlandia corymbosa var. corymbosa]